MYNCSLWVRTLDGFRITLIMWNWELLIESKGPTNKDTRLENSAPTGSAHVKTGRKKVTLVYRNQVSLLSLFFTIVSFIKHSWTNDSMNVCL